MKLKKEPIAAPVPLNQLAVYNANNRPFDRFIQNGVAFETAPLLQPEYVRLGILAILWDGLKGIISLILFIIAGFAFTYWLYVVLLLN